MNGGLADVLRLSGVVLACSTGCALLGGVRVDSLGSAAAPPGNVAAYVAVTHGDEPAGELTADDFTVYENEQKIPSTQSRQMLLERELVAAHRTLLLLDVSTASTPAARERLGKAVAGFLEKVRPTQPVTVYAFAGGGALRLLGEYPRSSGEPPRPPAIAPLDTSRDLHGAVRQAIGELDRLLARSEKPIRVGTLVVFAAGPDVAGRVTEAELDAALRASKHSLVVIADSPEAEPELAALARDGLVAPQAEDTLPIAFEEAAYKVRALYEKHYLLSYCSPARAGERRLRLEVRLLDEDGSFRSGDVTADFSARGFGSDCDPRAVPRFDEKRATPGEAGP